VLRRKRCADHPAQTTLWARLRAIGWKPWSTFKLAKPNGPTGKHVCSLIDW
jgi:hypothetical protein